MYIKVRFQPLHRRHLVNNLFPQSPLYIIESALEAFMDAQLASDDFLNLLEEQQIRVCGWLEQLTEMTEPSFTAGREMKELGLEGNALMSEALDGLYEAAAGFSEEGLEQATELLYEGHQLVEKSFQVCQKIDDEADEYLADSLQFIVA